MLGQRVRDPLLLLYPSHSGGCLWQSLLSRLQQKKQERWEEAVNSINFSHSSCKAWRTINKLTGRSGRSSRLCPISANSIALQLVKNGAHKTGGRESTRLVNKQPSDLWKIPKPEGHSVSKPFRPEEFAAALRPLKPRKSPGLDSIFLEFTLHAGSALKSWFCYFFNSCMLQVKIPKIWRRALVVASPKPEKLLWDVKGHHPISLLCVPFKILERLIYAHVETIIDPLLPQEQAGFRHGRSAVDQVTLLTQDIEDSFSAKKKVGALFADLTATYDTIWHRGLTCKLLRLLPDRHTVHMIVEMVGNRSFPLTTRNGQTSRLRRLKNGLPQESVLAPLLFNTYISDLPTTIPRKYAYADDLAIMHFDGDWQAAEGALRKDMATLGEYLWSRKLKLSTTKTISVVFHLNKKEAKRELKVIFNSETLPFCSEPKYLGVTWDRSLTYHRNLKSLRKKLTSHVTVLRRLAGSGWGAGATTLRTATLTLVHSTAEQACCTPVWCRSAHNRLIDSTINDALRILTACLRPTPADKLPILAGIQPAELHRSGATLSLGRRAMEPGHLLHSAFTRPSSSVARHLKSRHPFVPAAQQLVSFSDNSNIRAGQWADHQWNTEWADYTTRLRTLIPDTSTHTPGMTLPRRAWVRLNLLRTGVGHFRSCLYKWVMTSSAACECGAEEQTVDHVVLQCPIHRPLGQSRKSAYSFS